MLLMTFDETMSNDFLLEYVKGNPSYLGREYDDRLKNVLESKISSALAGEVVSGWLRHRRDQQSQ